MGSAVEIDDGSFLCAGSTQFNTDDLPSPDEDKVKLFRLAPNGTLMWDTLLTPTECGALAVSQIQSIGNDEFLINGWSGGSSTEVDYNFPNFMMRINLYGEVLQFYQWDFEHANLESYPIKKAEDEYMVAWTDCYDPIYLQGDGLRKVYSRKFDLLNEWVLWDHEMEYEFDNPVITDFIATPDSGYAISGYDVYLDGYGQYHSFIVKADSLGNSEWMNGIISKMTP